MSSSRLIFGIVLGAGLATGSLYFSQNLSKFPWVSKSIVGELRVQTQLEQVRASLDDAAKTNDKKQLDAVGETVAIPDAPPVDKSEVDKVIAQEEPSLAGREISANARETMAAAISMKKRMEGTALTGNENQDQQLAKLEKEERGNSATAQPSQAQPTERKPATATVIEFDGTKDTYQSDEDRIRQLAVPESVRQEILQNYRRTGVLPSFADSK